jgi:hypothetical protein
MHLYEGHKLIIKYIFYNLLVNSRVIMHSNKSIHSDIRVLPATPGCTVPEKSVASAKLQPLQVQFFILVVLKIRFPVT